MPVTLFEPFLKVYNYFPCQIPSYAELTALYLQYSIAQAIIYGLGVYFAKTTILILLLRIFGIDQKFRAVTWFVIAVWTTWTIIDVCLCLFGCNPIRKAWEPLLPGTCIDIIQVGIASGYINIVTDVAILVLPIPMVWQLHLRTKLKVAVTAVFLCGTL